MQHVATDSEMAITAKMDFIVPLKEIGLITRAVLEGIYLFYRPRRIIVVASGKQGVILRRLLPYWNVSNVEFIAEESFFMRNMKLSMDDILAQYDATREGDQREPGWWIQQLIKLGAATQIPNISTHYVVWDGDLVPIRRWRLCQRNANGSISYFIAILQERSRSEFNTTQYAGSMRALTGMEPLDPVNGGTYVAHHMVFNVHYVKELIKRIIAMTGLYSMPWPLIIMSYSRKFYRFSEYKTYATFMQRYHPTEFSYHELDQFGEGGLRFRDANTIVEDMLKQCKLTSGGLSYVQIIEYMSKHWETLSLSKTIPGYVQLDHVYGLEGVDLNITDSPQSITEEEKLLVTFPTIPSDTALLDPSSSPSIKSLQTTLSHATAKAEDNAKMNAFVGMKRSRWVIAK